MSIEELPNVEPVVETPDRGGPAHRMRTVTNEVASGSGWDSDRAREVGSFFDSLAPEWTAKRQDQQRSLPVVDALSRGGVELETSWLELGCGTGSATTILKSQVNNLVAVDLSAGMLAQTPPELGPFVQADASSLPFQDKQFGGVMLMNMFLFPAEIDRILNDVGWLVWVNSRAEQTPIHLSPSALVEALPGEWFGYSSRAGTGQWVTLTRKRP